jgi:GntR family transcriptional regulator, transcriptional repressor for pyruvate dehydrogenase complex
VRQPRLAEMVAATLRERIVDGTLPDGGHLPPLDRLVDEFNVSPPSVREALRILENERLITVRRGSVGGAEVHRPKPDAAAYMLGLVLQASETPAADLAEALTQLVTVCAGMCARRRDRRKTVVPALRRSIRESLAHIDDAVEMERWARRFHNELIEGSGNATLILVAGALEGLWARQSEAWTYRVTQAHEAPGSRLREEGLHDHEAIADAIAWGDVELTEKLVRAHVGNPQIYQVRKRGSRVRATDVSWSGGAG